MNFFFLYFKPKMILYFYLVIVGLPVILVRSEKLTCTRDEDCDEEYSCSNKICTKCLKCDVLLRKGNGCVTDFNQCRECLKGYEEVLLTDSSHVIKPCKPIRLKEKLNSGKCVIDNSCPPDNYCHDEICVRCFNCSLVNRVSNDRCAKDLSDCGSCMNGYEEVAVTTDSNLKPCERQSLINVSKTRNYNMSAIDSAYVFALIILVVGITASCVVLKKGTVLNKSRCLEFPSAPPLHEMDPLQHVIQVVEQEPHVAWTVEQNQQAKVFKQPNASYYYEEDKINTNNYEAECMPNNTMNLSVPTVSDQSENEEVHSGRIFLNNFVEPRADVNFPHQSMSTINEIEGSNINGNNTQSTNIPVEEVVSATSSITQLEVNPST